MTRWRIGWPRLILLGCVVVVMLVIVVLPDVDLLDTAFQRGTAPIAVHAQATSAPPAVHLPTALQLPDTTVKELGQFLLLDLALFSGPNFLPILLGSLRC
jgi:ABC-type sulfate transport system permease subunit